MKKWLLFLLLLFAPIAQAAPNITVSGNSVTILGAAQTISLTCTLIDPNNTGNLHSGSNIITVFVTSTTTPGNVATCGPLYGNDVILDGFGNANTTYYKVQVFTVSNSIVASTPALQQFYAFTGSGTVDLSTATPLAPSFMSGANGNVVIPGTLSLGTNTLTVSGVFNATGGGSFGGTFSGTPTLSGLITFSSGLTSAGPNTLNGGGTTAGAWAHAGANTFNSTFTTVNFLVPVSAASGALGTAPLPFGSLVIGQTANNTASLQGTFTGNRTVTVPDATGILLIGSIPPTATGTAAGLTGTGACATFSNQVGGAWAGSAKCTAATAASTLTITPGLTAPNGWTCDVWDETTRANVFQQTSHSTTTCVLTVTSVTQNDVFVFKAVAF